MRTVRRWAAETAGGLPRQFWYLWTGTLINRVGSFVIILLAFYLTEERGFSPSFAGFVIGLWGAGGAAGTLIGGVLADRWGRRPTFLTAMYGSALMMLALGFARGKGEIALAVLLLGVTSEAVRPAMSALMIDIVPDRDRLRAFSLNYWVINVGFAVAAATAGFVASIDYTLLFVLDAATTTAAATLIAVKVAEPRRPKIAVASLHPRGRNPGTGRSRRPGLVAVFTDRVFMAYVAVNVLTAMIFMQHTSTLPMAMSRDGLAPSTFGAIIALNGVLIVAGQLFIPRLVRGYRHATTLAVAGVVIGIGFGLNALADAAWVYGVAVLVWTFGEMLNSPSNSTTNAELSPAHLRGRYQGVFSLSWSAAAFAAPVIGATVLQHAGDTVLWLGCLGLGVVVALMHVAAGPGRERRAAALRAAEAIPAQAIPVEADVDAIPAAVGPAEATGPHATQAPSARMQGHPVNA